MNSYRSNMWSGLNWEKNFNNHLKKRNSVTDFLFKNKTWTCTSLQSFITAHNYSGLVSSAVSGGARLWRLQELIRVLDHLALISNTQMRRTSWSRSTNKLKLFFRKLRFLLSTYTKNSHTVVQTTDKITTKNHWN